MPNPYLNPDGTVIADTPTSTGGGNPYLNPDGTVIADTPTPNMYGSLNSIPIVSGPTAVPGSSSIPQTVNQSIPPASPSSAPSINGTAQTTGYIMGSPNNPIPNSFPITDAHVANTLDDTASQKLTYLNGQVKNNPAYKGYQFTTDNNGNIVYSNNGGQTYNQFEGLTSGLGNFAIGHAAPIIQGIVQGTAGTLAAPGGPAASIAASAAGADAANTLKRELAVRLGMSTDPVFTTGSQLGSLAGGALNQTGANYFNTLLGTGEEPALSDVFGTSVKRQFTPSELNPIPGTQRVSNFFQKLQTPNLSAIQNANKGYITESLGNGSNSLGAALSPDDNLNLYQSTPGDLNQQLANELKIQTQSQYEDLGNQYDALKDDASDIPFTSQQNKNLIDDISSQDFVNDNAINKQAKLIKSLQRGDIQTAADLINFKQSHQFGQYTSDGDLGTNRELQSLVPIFDQHLEDAVSSDPTLLSDLQTTNAAYSRYKNNLEPILNAINDNKNDSGFNTVGMLRGQGLTNLNDLDNAGYQGLGIAQPTYEVGLAQQLGAKALPSDVFDTNRFINAIRNPKMGDYLKALMNIKNSEFGPSEGNEIMGNLQDLAANRTALPQPKNIPNTLGSVLEHPVWTAIKGLGSFVPATARTVAGGVMSPIYNPGNALMNIPTGILSSQSGKNQ